MFYAEIGALADRSGLGSDQDPPDPPALPPDWVALSNSMVLKALRADRKFAPGKARDSQAGIALLREAIADAERRLGVLPVSESGRDAALSRDRDAARRAAASRHRIFYYRMVLALLYVRLGWALERAGDAAAETPVNTAPKKQPSPLGTILRGVFRRLYSRPRAAGQAEDMFRTALLKQPTPIDQVAIEYARFLARRGRFEEADQALCSTRSMTTARTKGDIAQGRAVIAGGLVEGARKRGELRLVLPILERNRGELARLRAELGDADTRQSGDLLGWHANAAYWHGQVLAETGDHRRAAEAFETSRSLYAQQSEALLSVMVLSELLGDERARLGDLRAAAEAYADGAEQWRAAGRSPTEHERAKLLAGKYALVCLALGEVNPLDRYEAEFPGGAPGPFRTIVEQAEPLLVLPGVVSRLKLFLHGRLRGAPCVARARDCVFALRQLIWRAVRPPDFHLPGAAADAQTLRPFDEPIRLELDPRLLGPPLLETVHDQEAALIARAGLARERIYADWGVVLPGIVVVSSASEGRYRILIRGNPVEEKQLSPALPGLWWMPRWTRKRALAPAAEQVFLALERCMASNLPRLVGRTELFWMLQRHQLLPPEGSVERFEAESAATMAALVSVVRALLLQRVRVVAFPALYARFRAGIAAGESPDRIVAAIRRMPEVNAQLWGTDGWASLFPFRVSSADTARLAAAAASPGPAGSRLLQAVKTQCATLPAGACLVVPDPAVRQLLQSLVAEMGHPVLSDDEVPPGSLASVQPLPLAEPPPEGTNAPTVLDRTPAGPPRRLLRQLIVQEVLQRGLSQPAGRRVFRHAVMHREDEWIYAAELALDAYGPDEVAFLAGLDRFGALESWAAAGGPEQLRRGIYDDTGVYVPPIRVRLCDTLPRGDIVLAFNECRETLPVNLLRDTLRRLTDQKAFVAMLRNALVRHLAGFIGNRQAERLLIRLNAEQPLLVANALECLGIPLILQELRRLVAANQSIRNLQPILDTMLSFHGRPDTERWPELLKISREFPAT